MEDEMHYIRMQMAEMQGQNIHLSNTDIHVASIPAVAVIDAKSIHDVLIAKQGVQQMTEKRTALELLSYMQNTKRNGTKTRWVHGEANLADGLTKDKANAEAILTKFLKMGQEWSLVDDPRFRSAKKRKAEGIERLQGPEAEAQEESEEFEVMLTRLIANCWPMYKDPEDDDSDIEWYAEFPKNA